jgi:hypothetical protein
MFTAETIGETVAVILGTIKALDSATSCQQREDFQMLCPTDSDCPRCLSKSIAVLTLKGPTIAAVLVQDLIRRLPHMTLDDGVCPNAYRTNFYGNFPFSTLNRKDFKDRGGEPIFYSVTVYSLFSSSRSIWSPSCHPSLFW